MNRFLIITELVCREKRLYKLVHLRILPQGSPLQFTIKAVKLYNPDHTNPNIQFGRKSCPLPVFYRNTDTDNSVG